jgi:hypothetical protein
MFAFPVLAFVSCSGIKTKDNAANAAQGCARDTEFVHVSALRHAMSKHAAMDHGRFSCYVLENPELLVHFQSFDPQVVPNESGRFQKSPDTVLRVFDVRSGLPVKMWLVDKNKSETRDTEATVKIFWYESYMVCGMLEVLLEKHGEDWIVVSDRVDVQGMRQGCAEGGICRRSQKNGRDSRNDKSA